MHFWKGSDIIAIFKDRQFEFNYHNKDTWQDVIAYGKTLGLPDSELDFPIKGL